MAYDGLVGSDQEQQVQRHNNVAMMALSKEPNQSTCFQKTLTKEQLVPEGEDRDYPWGGIQMLGKADGEQLKGKAPHFLAWAAKLTPERALDMVAHHSVDFWLSSEDLPGRRPGRDSAAGTEARGEGDEAQ